MRRMRENVFSCWLEHWVIKLYAAEFLFKEMIVTHLVKCLPFYWPEYPV
jgi:hypothetical protein